jgi:hypothetical protein
MGLENRAPTAIAQAEFEPAALMVKRFVRRFDNESYRMLAHHAALPLILTPELVNYLRNAFLRGLNPPLPWIAEADLLLSDLCDQVGYDQYAMKPPVRSYLIAEMRERLGPKPMQDIARLVLNYIQHQKRAKTEIEQRQLHAQELAAMVCLDDKRSGVARELAELFRQAFKGPVDDGGLARLARLTQTLAPQLSAYPELVRFAEECLSQLLPKASALFPAESIRIERQGDVPFSTETIPAAVERSQDENAGVRRDAINTLGQLAEKLEPATIQRIAEGLHDINAEVRRASISALGRRGERLDRTIIQAIAACLRDENAGVRGDAIKTLGQLADKLEPATIQRIAEDLNDVNAGVRRASINALSRRGERLDRTIIQAIAARLQDENAGVRGDAIKTLGELADELELTTIQRIAEGLNDTNAAVRRASINALGRCGERLDRTIIQAIAARLRDEDFGVRAVANKVINEATKEQDSEAEIFDVFLCHNSQDKPAVREIAMKLVDEGIKPWLDEAEIRPGTSWQTALERQIRNIKSAAVFIGGSGVGPWQQREIQVLLNHFLKLDRPIIPVVLSSAETVPELPWVLNNIDYVDFRAVASQPLQRLIWAITGKKPPDFHGSQSMPRPAVTEEPKAHVVGGVNVEATATVISRGATGSFSESELVRLGQKYQEIRGSMPAGNERTSKMNDLVKEVQEVAPNIQAEAIRQLFGQGSPGSRIVAIALLERQPDEKCFDLILQSITESKSPFEQYHALHAAGRILPKLSSSDAASLIRGIRSQINVSIPESDQSRWTISQDLLKRYEATI